MSYRSVLLVCFLILVATGSHAGGKDDPFLIMGKLDQLEVRDTEGDDPLVLEGAVWAGYDLNKVWLKADVERVDSETEELELQALYGRAIAPFWDIQLGARKDLEPKPSREWGVIALRGLAPYLFDVGASLFIGGAGRTALRLEAEYEMRFTQKLVLVPEIELNAYGHNDRQTGVGSGLADTDLGLRLRYAIRREFAPYVGLNWQKKYGNSADFASAAGHDVEDTQLVLGIRAWF
ncbi:MAG: copper resistance protein CopB [Spongiibacteraceae bacterium]|jgi:copper resistance protein B|nr:copper resistance protein CopB [Spongiibacteraceae bacterium]